MTTARTHSMMILIGLSLLLGGVISMAIPMSLHAVDTRQLPITCGTAWTPDTAVAASQDRLNKTLHQSDSRFATSAYTEECGQLLGQRRSVAVAAVALGLLLAVTPIVSAYRVLPRLWTLLRATRQPGPAAVPAPVGVSSV